MSNDKWVNELIVHSYFDPSQPILWIVEGMKCSSFINSFLLFLMLVHFFPDIFCVSHFLVGLFMYFDEIEVGNLIRSISSLSVVGRSLFFIIKY